LILFKAKDPQKLSAWYTKHLGIAPAGDGVVSFRWRSAAPIRTGYTVWSLFPETTRYFDPSPAPFMINYRVANLDAVLAALRHEGVTVDERTEKSEFGRFGWVTDPEGNRIELWEPPNGSSTPA